MEEFSVDSENASFINRSPNTTSGTIQIVIESLIAFFASVTNGALILLILTSRSLRKPTNYLIVSLCCSGLTMGVVILPLHLMADFMKFPGKRVMCVFVHSFILVTFSGSLVTSLLIASERSFAIVHPFLYIQYATTKNVLIVCVLSWLLAACMFIYPMVYYSRINFAIEDCSFTSTIPSKYGVALISIGFVFFFLIASFYVRIYFVVRRHLRRIAANESMCNRLRLPLTEMRGPSPSPGRCNQIIHAELEKLEIDPKRNITTITLRDTLSPELQRERGINRNYNLEQPKLKKESKKTAMLAIIILCTLTCMLPIMIVIIIKYHEIDVPTYILIPAMLLCFVLGLSDAFVFGFAYKEFRKAFVYKFYKMKNWYNNIFSKNKAIGRTERSLSLSTAKGIEQECTNNAHQKYQH